MQQDLYAVLGLSASATVAEIKQAFRQQASIHHPDRNPLPQAQERFRAAQQAYEILSDPIRRQAYDANRQRNLLDDPLAAASQIWGDYVDRLLSRQIS